jgi:DNA-binding transcriptional LysR family regulator
MVSMGEWAFGAAIGGLGLAIGRLPLLDDDIAAGRLAIAVDNVVSAETGYWLIAPRGSKRAAKWLPSAIGWSRKWRSCGGTARATAAPRRSRLEIPNRSH